MVNFMRSGLDLNRDQQIPVSHRGILDMHQGMRMISDRRNDKQERKVSSQLNKVGTKLDLRFTSAQSQTPSEEKVVDVKTVHHE